MTQLSKILWFVVFTPAVLLPSKAAAQSAPPAADSTFQATGTSKARVVEAYGRLPLSFEANQGQSDPRVKFLSRTGGQTLYLTPTEALFSSGSRSALRLKLVGANRNAQTIGLDKLPGNSNYFLGSDPAKWHTNVPTYAKVRYGSIYPGVDLVFYGNQRELEYDFVVAPGANPATIRMAVRSSQELSIDEHGNAVVHSGSGEIKLLRPRIYQEINGKREEVDGRYALRRGELRFQLGKYDRRQTLVIDPVIAYATYLGGASGDGGVGIAVDSGGNAYVTGNTLGGFPTTLGVVQPNATLTRDVFISKLNATGTALIYSTYLGGSLENDAFAIAVDSSGSAYVTGQTISTDFPITARAFQPQINAAPDAFVTKLSPDGSSLAYSTYLGGSANDTAFAIAVDTSGNAYVAGETQSANFPNIASALNVSQPSFCDPTIAVGFDAFIVKLNPDGKSLAYSLYLGGSGTDRANGVAVDSSGNAYVTGNTDSTDFLSGACPNSLSWTNPGGTHGFVVKVSPDGTAFLYASELGGSGTDVPTSIAVNGAGQVYVGGATSSADFGSGNAGSLDAFVAWLDSSGHVFMTKTIGGSGFDAGRGVAFDPSGDVYITGETNSTNFPVLGAFQSTYGGGNSDVFVAEFSSAGSLLFSTYLGGSGTDTASIGGAPIAVDGAGNIYVTGSTTSTDFPGVNASSIQPTNAGGGDAFIAKLSAPNTPVSNPPGTPVTVALNNNAVTGTFQGGVTQAGTTTAANLGANCPPAPTGFQFGNPPVCYDISTTAQFSGLVQVCISDPSVTANSRLVHFVTGSPVDITSLPVTPPTICGTTSSLSPFAILQLTAQTSATTTSISTANVTYGTSATATVSVSSPGGTVSGNVTLSLDGGAPLSMTLSNGSASFALGVLNAGSHSLVASFAAQGSFLASTGNTTLTVSRASVTITANNATKILNAPNPVSFGWSATGFVNGENASVLTANPTCTTTAMTTSPVGSYPITCSGASAANYTFSYVAGTLKIQYSTSIGHIIQPPINADGSSVLKQGRTVPAKFNVYDANGAAIGTPGVVSSFFLTTIVSGTTTTTVEDVVDTNNPDTAFRWDGQEWIFNIATANLSAGSTYIYTITLNDGSTIVFQYGLR